MNNQKYFLGKLPYIAAFLIGFFIVKFAFCYDISYLWLIAPFAFYGVIFLFREMIRYIMNKVFSE